MQSLSFDYIVIGSGPGGCVLAKMLSDDNKSSVLLLEAGTNEDANAEVISLTTNMYGKFPEYFCPGDTIPQKNVNGRSFGLTGGRVAGGGSSVNGEMYVRPSLYVQKQWNKIGGNLWSPENITAGFVALEKFNGKTDNPKVHGAEGLLHIRQVFPETPTLIQKLVSAIEEGTGYKAVLDYNNPDTPLGPFAHWQLYQLPNGDRASASVCFLGADVVTPDGKGVNGRKLTVSYQSTATRVLFNDSKEACGVEYLYKGKTCIAAATKKVILCAGIHSAQILLLSGVGPREELEKAGVDVVYNNPAVGKNLAGDSYTYAMFSINEKDADGLSSDSAGKWTGGAFLPNPMEDTAKDHREIQFLCSRVGDKLRVGIIFVNPRSRGSLSLQSDDPLKIMLGDYGFLTDKHDLETMKKVFRTYIVGMEKAFQKIDPAYKMVSPSVEELQDDAKLENYIKNTFAPSFHEQCELLMAPEDKGGVVDSEGQVYGVKNLLVGDTSIVPYHTDGNTSACSYIIGYTLAKNILANAKE